MIPKFFHYRCCQRENPASHPVIGVPGWAASESDWWRGILTAAMLQQTYTPKLQSHVFFSALAHRVSNADLFNCRTG
jgi:hypothetical protein